MSGCPRTGCCDGVEGMEIGNQRLELGWDLTSMGDGGRGWWYCSSPKTTDIGEMEKNVVACLDDIPLMQILYKVCGHPFITQVFKLVCKVYLSICTGSNRARGSLG